MEGRFVTVIEASWRVREWLTEFGSAVRPQLLLYTHGVVLAVCIASKEAVSE